MTVGAGKDWPKTTNLAEVWNNSDHSRDFSFQELHLTWIKILNLTVSSNKTSTTRQDTMQQLNLAFEGSSLELATLSSSVINAECLVWLVKG